MPQKIHGILRCTTFNYEINLLKNLHIDKPGDITYYFAMRAYDTAGRNVAGDISTIAMASMADLDNGNRGLNVGAVVGIVIGAVAFVCVVIGVTLGVMKKPPPQQGGPGNEKGVVVQEKKAAPQGRLAPIAKTSSTPVATKPLPPINKGHDNKGYIHRTGGGLVIKS